METTQVGSGYQIGFFFSLKGMDGCGLGSRKHSGFLTLRNQIRKTRAILEAQLTDDSKEEEMNELNGGEWSMGDSKAKSRNSIQSKMNEVVTFGRKIRSFGSFQGEFRG